MYNPANGYAAWPAPSSYDPSWVAAYRTKQRDRNQRLDDIAREYLADQQKHRVAMREAAYASMAPKQQMETTRRARLSKAARSPALTSGFQEKLRASG